jgi:hypothetical protein
MAVINEPNIVSLRGGHGLTAGQGEVGVIFSNGQSVTYNVVNPPPTVAAAESSAVNAHNRDIQRFSEPGSPGAGPGSYLWVGREIFVLSAPPAYTLDFTVTLQSATNSFAGHTGLTFIRSAGGKLYLAGICGSTTVGRVVVVYLDLTDIASGWTQQEITVTDIAGSGYVRFVHALAHEGELWATSGLNIVAWNPDTKTIRHIAADAGPRSRDYYRLFEVRGRLFWVGSTGGTMRFNEVSGPIAIRRHSFGGNNHSSAGHWGGFVIANQLFTFHYQAGGGSQGIRHYVHTVNDDTIGGSVSLAEHTSPVIPPAGSQGGGGGWPDDTANWAYGPSGPVIPGTQIKCYTLNSNPIAGFLNAVRVHFTFTSGGNHEVWAYGSTAAPMTQITPIPFTVVSAMGDDTFPVDDSGVDHRAFTQNNVTLHQATLLPNGNVRLSFFAVSAVFTPLLSVAFYYTHVGATISGPHCRNKCQLVAASVTGVDQFATPALLDIPNNRVTQVTAENNGGAPFPTLYTVDWDRNAQAAPDGWCKIQAIFEP